MNPHFIGIFEGVIKPLVSGFSRSGSQISNNQAIGRMVADIKELVESSFLVDIELVRFRKEILKPALVGILNIEIKKSGGESLLATPGNERQSDFGLGDPAFASLGENDTCRFGHNMEKSSTSPMKAGFLWPRPNNLSDFLMGKIVISFSSPPGSREEFPGLCQNLISHRLGKSFPSRDGFGVAFTRLAQRDAQKEDFTPLPTEGEGAVVDLGFFAGFALHASDGFLGVGIGSFEPGDEAIDRGVTEAKVMLVDKVLPDAFGVETQCNTNQSCYPVNRARLLWRH